MQHQLRAIAAEFDQASHRLRQLEERLPDDLWSVRADPERWSVSECIAHLNITSDAFLPPLRTALAESRALGHDAPRRYRRDPLGWLLWQTMGPPARMKVKTPPSFVPLGGAGPVSLRAEFGRLQVELQRCVGEGDSLPLQSVKLSSPFSERARYSIFSALSIVPRHQHRHLWQAEQVAAAHSRQGAIQTPR